MSALSNKASIVASHMIEQSNTDKLTALDPFVLYLIELIIKEVILYWIGHRKKPETALDKIKNPGILDRWLFKRNFVKPILKDRYSALGQPIYLAMLEAGKECTVDDIEKLYKEVINK
jgi:hypothetical protein